MLLFIHTCLWIALALTVIIGYRFQSSKRIVQAMIYSRFIYFLVIISQFVISVRVWGNHNPMIIFNAVLCVITISMIELGFLQKVTMRMRPALMLIISFTILINVVSQQLMV